MGQDIPQLTFTSGVLAPALHARNDLSRYHSGARKLENFIVRPYGGVSNRPGTKFVAELGEKARLIPFQFSTVQTYMLAFGNYTLKIFKDGGQVVYPVGHAQAGQPVVISTIYPLAVLPRLKYTQSADVMTLVHPDYPPQQLSRTNHHVWSFAPFNNIGGPFLEINVDTQFTIYASSNLGNVTLRASANMFTADMVGRMIYLEQSPDAATKKWEVQKAVVINDIVRAGSSFYRATASGTTGTVKPDHVEGIEYDGNPGVPWLYLHSGSGIALITGYTSGTQVSATVLSQLPGLLVSAAAAKTIETVTPGDGGPTPVRVQITGHGFVNGQSYTVQGVAGTTGANGTWQITVIDADHFDLNGCFDNQPYVYGTGGTVVSNASPIPTHKWALEAWGGEPKYPGVTTYYQQRQLFAASTLEPDTFWTSKTKGFLDFGTSTPVLDDDGVTFSVASREVQEIRHALELTDLILFTSGGVWVIKGSSDGVLTPSSVNSRRQGAIGASHIPPAIVGNNAVYVTDKGGQVRSIGYSFQSDSFAGNDLTTLAHHLFTSHTVTEMVFQQVPFSCLWLLRDDGVLLGLTYMPEQEVAGWHTHTTDGKFFSVGCVSEGGADVIYLGVERTIGGVSKYYLERMSDRATGLFMDSAASYSGGPVSTISGLGYLEGKTVAVLGDGVPQAQKVVSGGSITLSSPASVVHVGLPLVAELETLDISAPQSNIRTAPKLVNSVSVMVDESKDLLAGPDKDQLMTYVHDAALDAPEDNLIRVSIPTTWQKSARITIRQDKPLPLSVLAVIPNVTTGS